MCRFWIQVQKMLKLIYYRHGKSLLLFASQLMPLSLLLVYVNYYYNKHLLQRLINAEQWVNKIYQQKWMSKINHKRERNNLRNNFVNSCIFSAESINLIRMTNATLLDFWSLPDRFRAQNEVLPLGTPWLFGAREGTNPSLRPNTGLPQA